MVFPAWPDLGSPVQMLNPFDPAWINRDPWQIGGFAPCGPSVLYTNFWQFVDPLGNAIGSNCDAISMSASIGPTIPMRNCLGPLWYPLLWGLMRGVYMIDAGGRKIEKATSRARRRNQAPFIERSPELESTPD